MRKVSFIFLALLAVASCERSLNQDKLSVPQNPNLKFFGFSLVDVFFDDPTDDKAKSNYCDEVADFSNLADILIYEPSQNIISNLEVMHNYDLLAYLHLNELFFEIKEMGGDKSGVIYALRSDYRERWDEFKLVNNLQQNQTFIKAFYMGEEPFWNGITREDLEKATNYVKADFPNVKIMLIEASVALDELQIPESVDWVGFDHYFIKDPFTNPKYQEELSLLKTKMSEHQEIIVVLDSHFLPLFHRIKGIRKNNLDEVARNYYDVANSDEKIVGIIGYYWPSGFEFENATGARGLPEHVINEYKRIGKAVSRK
jgi:hypothetical protein